MAFRLKHKIALGGFFLFFLLILAGGVSYYFLHRISTEAREIIKDNYETLNYSRDMLLALDMFEKDPRRADSLFENALRLQEKNITETGEREITAAIRDGLEKIHRAGYQDSLALPIRESVASVMRLNLKAIDKKNQHAQASAAQARTIITVLLTLCLLAGFTFLFNFPALVASPIASLTEGIRGIAARNYSQRIHLERKDEFGELAAAFNSMAEKLDEYEHSNLARILFEKQRAETVIDSLKDASIGIDQKGIILFANRPALHLLHLQESDVVGKPRQELEGRNDLFRYLVQEKENTPFRIVVDGKENYFTREWVEIKQDNQRSGLVIILKNITPYKELDVAKTQFIATISHELKTPLASADFSLKLLEDERVGTLNDEQKELVKSLRDDNRRLLRMLSELLDMSQAESGKLRLQIQTVDPVQLVSQAVSAVNNLARGKNIRIETKINAAGIRVQADPDKTVWVLSNFLSNAVRYSPEGGQVIVELNPAGGKLEFSVQDFGKGIDPQYQDKIFDRYFRIPGTVQDGTGLGLAICREFMEAQGGTVWLDTGSGPGSRFVFALPVTV